MIPVSSNTTSFTIISQNINGKYTEATNNLDIETYKNLSDIICWQETHTEDYVIRQHTNKHILNNYVPIHLTNLEKSDKAIANKASRVINSEGVLTFVKKNLMPSTRIIDISRRTIAIAITTGFKEETLLINVYTPATVTENNSFWSKFGSYISSCKSKCSGKVAVMIVGDLNATILKWHNGNSKNFINKNSKHITNLMDKYKLNLPCHKPTSHTFSRNIRSGS